MLRSKLSPDMPTASIVTLTEPITASLLSVATLSETPASPQLLGMGLILLTATALSVHSGA